MQTSNTFVSMLLSDKEMLVFPCGHCILICGWMYKLSIFC